jgi:hypothetical protein
MMYNPISCYATLGLAIPQNFSLNFNQNLLLFPPAKGLPYIPSNRVITTYNLFSSGECVSVPLFLNA